MAWLQTLPEFNQFVEFFAGSKLLQKITAWGTVAMLDVKVNITYDCRSRTSVDQGSFLNADNIVKTCNSFTQISKQCKDLFQESMTTVYFSVKIISHLAGQQLTWYLVS